jgi:hypothetical protein
MRKMLVLDERTVWFYNPNLASDMDEVCEAFWGRLGF